MSVEGDFDSTQDFLTSLLKQLSYLHQPRRHPIPVGADARDGAEEIAQYCVGSWKERGGELLSVTEFMTKCSASREHGYYEMSRREYAGLRQALAAEPKSLLLLYTRVYYNGSA